MSVAMEAAARNAKQLGGPSNNSDFGLSGGAIHRLDKERNNAGGFRKREFYRCGNTKHLVDVCPFMKKECYGCKQTGHIRKKCKSSGKKGFNGNTRVDCNQASIAVNEVNDFERKEEDMLSNGMNFLTLYALGTDNKRYDPVLVELELNRQKVKTGRWR